MMSDVVDALARVPSPVEVLGDGVLDCRACRRRFTALERDLAVIPEVGHRPGCWWPAFVQARDALAALAAGVTVEALVLVDDYDRTLLDEQEIAKRFFGQRVTVTVRPVEGDDANPS